MKWPSAGGGTEARHAQKPMKIVEHCPSCSISRHSSRRQATVESESLPEIWCPTPTVASCSKKCNEFQKSRGPARWQRGGQRYQRQKRATNNGSFWATTPPRAQSGQSLDVSSWKVARFTAAKSCGEPAARRSRWQVPQVWKEARVPTGWKRQSQRCLDCVSERMLCLGFPVPPWFTAFCCRDGSLAVIQPLRVQPTAGESSR